MVHNEKLTVPLLISTPPPCKHKRKTCENPIGAMGTFEGLCGTYNLKLTEASVAVAQTRIKASASAFFPSGRWELSNMSTHILHLRESKQVRQHFSHRGDGNFKAMEQFQVSAARTPCSDRKVSRKCASENRESRQARQQFSHRGDGNF